MREYTQLTYEGRYHICSMRKEGYSQSFIAKTMNRSKSTISRELSRNTGKKGYCCRQAHRFAGKRHQEKNKATKLTKKVADYTP